MDAPTACVWAFAVIAVLVSLAGEGCAGVDRHPCDFQQDPSWLQSENPKDSVPADCNADAYPVTSGTNGAPTPATSPTGVIHACGPGARFYL